MRATEMLFQRAPRAPFRYNRNGALDLCIDAFSSREPVSTSLENALMAAAGLFHLHRRAGDRAIRAEDAAIAGLWPQQAAATLAGVEEQAGIRRHVFDLAVTAVGAGDLGAKFRLHGRGHYVTIILDRIDSKSS